MHPQSIAPAKQSMVPARVSTYSLSSLKSRQLSHLNSQIAQLQANLDDMDNLLRVTVKQAEYIRKLGILHGAL
jgi:conjugal transfer/entry exclusion protein